MIGRHYDLSNAANRKENLVNWYNYIACFFARVFLANFVLISCMGFQVTASQHHLLTLLEKGCRRQP